MEDAEDPWDILPFLELPNLLYLDIQTCKKTDHRITLLTNLVSLKLSGFQMDSPAKISNLKNLTELEVLALSPHHHELLSLDTLKNLRILSVYDIPVDIKSICSNITSLNLYSVEPDANHIRKFTSLTSLTLSYSSLRTESLVPLSNLQELNLDMISEISAIPELPCLEKLKIRHCDNDVSIHEANTELTELMWEIASPNFAVLEKFTKLRKLTCEDVSLNILEKLTNLELLHVCCVVIPQHVLTNLVNLTDLKMDNPDGISYDELYWLGLTKIVSFQ